MPTLAGERDFSPQVVGRIARLLSEKQAQGLIKAYLQEIAAEIAKKAGREAVAIQ
jgi:histone H3/H4